MMNIGASCVGRYFWFTKDCRVVEARILQNDEHPHFWEAVDICHTNRIKLIVTIDTFLTNSRWNPTDSELASFTDWLCRELINSGFDKSNCKISWDNEPEEHTTKEKYTSRLNLIHKTINGRFELIAGNTQASLDFIDYVAKNGKFEILGVHFQSSATTKEKIEYLGNEYRRIAKENNKRLTCTEANWFDVSTADGYQMLLNQLIKAEEIGCEDFCVVVIDQTFGYQNAPDDDANPWLAFLTDGKPRNEDNWKDFVRIINEKGDDDMKLEQYYYQNRPANLIRFDSKGYGIRFLRACFGLSDGNVFDSELTNKVKQYQTEKGLLVDGKVGPQTFGDMIKVEDFYKHYCWVHSLWARGL